jgi:L-2,4-diaminobutyrate decarboxylase
VTSDVQPPVCSRAAMSALRSSVATTLDGLERGWGDADATPWSGADPTALAATIASIDPCPAEGVAHDVVWAELADLVVRHSVDPGHTGTAAHLHCASMVHAASAELAVGALNQSMDSFDQAPAATYVEDHLVRWIGELMGYDGSCAGVFTTGGTSSNLLGLLLAREQAAPIGWSCMVDGLPPEAAGWRVLCSEAAHFSVVQALGVLGLGGRQAVAVPTRADGAMDPAALDEAISGLGPHERAIAIVGTAGTTDLGAIDPLPELAQRARAIGAWFHVDAAVASALRLSAQHTALVDGLELADSITVDLHKLWFQPISASTLLVRDRTSFASIRSHSAYLDRADDEAEGVLNLVSRSLDTTRRFDALKVLVALRSTGRSRMAAMVDAALANTVAAARALAAHDDLELATTPTTVTCVFRWAPAAVPDEATRDHVNREVQRRLFTSGRAVIGRTTHQGRTWLKLTILDPVVATDALTSLIELVVAEAAEVSADHRGVPA